jgi:hypothetical protein
MADEPTNLVPEQLRLICEEITVMRGEMTEKFALIDGKVDDLQAGQQALQGVLMSLGRSVWMPDNRVEHIEAKLGIET